MKKIFYYLLLTSLPLTISSCGEKPTEQPSENPTSETVTSEQVSVETPVFDEDMYYQEEAEDNYYHSLISEHSSTQEELDFNFEEKYHDVNNNLTNATAKYGELYLNGERIDNLSEG